MEKTKQSTVYNTLIEACSRIVDLELGTQEYFFRKVITEPAVSIVKELALLINNNPKIADEIIVSAKDPNSFKKLMDRLSLVPLINGLPPVQQSSITLLTRLILNRMTNVLQQVK